MALAVVRNDFYDLRNKFQTMLQVVPYLLHWLLTYKNSLTMRCHTRVDSISYNSNNVLCFFLD